MDFINKLMANDMQILIVLSFVIMLLLAIVILTNTKKLKKLSENYDKFMKNGFDGDNLESIIHKFSDDLEKYGETNVKMKSKLDKIEFEMTNCIQKIGMVRYKAFDDVGGDQSFSLSLLDKEDNGVVITSIHSTNMFSTYAKKVKNSESKNTLSEEEEKSIDLSKRNFKQYEN